MEKQLTSDLYGSASLNEAAPFDITATLNPEPGTSIPLGHNGDRTHGLAFNLGTGGDPGHALTFGATRSGKGVNAIIPTLLTYRGSTVTLDPNAENLWITGPWRSTFSRVVRLDPWDEVNERYGSQVGETVPATKFNPLSVLDPASSDFNDDVVAIADALTVRNEQTDNHWTDSARELIAGLIAAAVEANPGKASLRDVRELITADDAKLLAAITAIAEANPKSLGARKLRRFVPKPRINKKTGEEKPVTVSSEISSIRSTAETQTAVLDSESLLAAMETDAPPFDLAEIATGTISLYLVLPVDKLATHGRWLRLILTLAIRILARQRRPPAQPVLFILDEMGTIGPLSMVEQSFGLMAGLGIRIWGFLQDLSQLQRDYPRSWETFWANSSIIQVLTCGDLTTSEHVSRYLGTATVNAKTGGYSMKQRQYAQGDSFELRLRHVAAQILARRTDSTPQRAREVIDAARGGTYKPSAGIGDALLGTGRRVELDKKQDVAEAIDRAKADLHELSFTEQGYSEWAPDEQLASRPVLYPSEVRDSDPARSIIIRPGRGNYRLQRFEYFSDPVLSPRARHNPNKPAPIIKAPTLPIAAAPAPAPIATTYQPPPAPARPGPQSVGDELADLGKDLGKKAAGAAFNFIKDRVNR